MRPVLVDMDGVLADFDGQLFEIFGQALNCDRETQTHRFLMDHLTDLDGIPASEWRVIMRRIVEAQGWFRDLPLMPRAQEGIEFLESQGLDVWLCSKPLEASATCASEKFAWVEEHFPSLSGKLILAPNKGMVSGSVLIDDAINSSWLAYANWIPVVFDHPWNRQGKHSLEGHHGLKGRMDWSLLLRSGTFEMEMGGLS